MKQRQGWIDLAVEYMDEQASSWGDDYAEICICAPKTKILKFLNFSRFEIVHGILADDLIYARAWYSVDAETARQVMADRDINRILT